MPTMKRAFARRGSVLALAALGMVAGVSGANAQVATAKTVAPLVGEFHRIQNVGNGKCLQPQARVFA